MLGADGWRTLASGHGGAYLALGHHPFVRMLEDDMILPDDHRVKISTAFMSSVRNKIDDGNRLLRGSLQSGN